MLESKLFKVGVLLSYGIRVFVNLTIFLTRFFSKTRRVVKLTPTLSLVRKSLQPDTWHIDKVTQFAKNMQKCLT